MPFKDRFNAVKVKAMFALLEAMAAKCGRAEIDHLVQADPALAAACLKCLRQAADRIEHVTKCLEVKP